MEETFITPEQAETEQIEHWMKMRGQIHPHFIRVVSELVKEKYRVKSGKAVFTFNDIDERLEPIRNGVRYSIGRWWFHERADLFAKAGWKVAFDTPQGKPEMETIVVFMKRTAKTEEPTHEDLEKQSVTWPIKDSRPTWNQTNENVCN